MIEPYKYEDAGLTPDTKYHTRIVITERCGCDCARKPTNGWVVFYIFCALSSFALFQAIRDVDQNVRLTALEASK